jgi:precorrin-4/cobalt-precorrin-4 C11-methyltransferase
MYGGAQIMKKIWIIGAGPGDPDLITVKGLKLLKEADVVMYTDSLVSETLVVEAKESAEIIRTAGMHLEEMVNCIVERVNAGKTVVRLHTGDPAMYGATMEQVALLKQHDISSEIVPGVSSVFASAAAVGTELTIPDLTQTLILTRAEGRTPVPERENEQRCASCRTTLPAP